jgi:ZIP family zinc transporter
MPLLAQLLLYALVPSLAIFSGGMIASYRPLSKTAQSLVQHIAAGVVFAALVGEVLPDLTASHPNPLLIIAGFAFGVILMLGMRLLIESRIKQAENAPKNPLTLILVVGIDILIDGFLIGVGLALGEINGTLIALALGIEILFLGMATGAEMHEGGLPRRQIFWTLLALVIPPIVGVLAGGLIFSGVPHNVVVVVLSFAAAALLYLVTEELLVEAHASGETPFATAMFFVGFLILYILELIF